MLIESIIKITKDLQNENLLRQRVSLQNLETNLINFSSSDYLSLKNNKEVKEGFEKGFRDYPTGSAGSMVVCGYHKNHRALEEAFAKALGCDDALLFSSGFAANLSIISMLAKLKAHIFIDKAAHASFYDGLQLSKANYQRFLHNNIDDLALKLDANKQNQVIISESVFSMSGAIAPLRQISQLSKKTFSDCLIDEAHAFGVFGPKGLGLIENESLSQQEIPLRMIPFGKAFACQGAIVVGQKAWIEALLQLARPYIYSTALSPALSYGLLHCFDYMQRADNRREKLYSLIDYFNQKAKLSSLNFRPSLSPIQQLQLGDTSLSLTYSQLLRKAGIFCQAMRQPTVTKQETGLRIILNYQHSYENLDYLFEELQKLNEHSS